MGFEFSDLTDAVKDAGEYIANDVVEQAVYVVSNAAVAVSPILGPGALAFGLLGGALPGLVRGERLSKAVATGIQYQALRAWNFIKAYAGGQPPEQAARTTAEGETRLIETFRKPSEVVIQDPNLRAEFERAKAAAAARGADLDEALTDANLSPEKLAQRLSAPGAPPAREDAVALSTNVAIGLPLYDPDWFDPGSGRFISDLDALRRLRAVARHRLAPPTTLAVLDRRIDAEQRRLGIPPPDVQTILNKTIDNVTSDELARVLQAAKDLAQPEPILDLIRGTYEQKLREEREAASRENIATQATLRARGRPSLFAELLTGAILTAPAWVPLLLLPALRERGARRRT